MITDHTLRLMWQTLRWAQISGSAFDRITTVQHCADRFFSRETRQVVLARIQRESLACRRLDYRCRPARAGVLADLRRDGADDTVRRKAQDHAEAALEHSDCR